MISGRIATFILLTFFGLGLLSTFGCSNAIPEDDSEDAGSFSASPTLAGENPAPASQVVAVTTTLKDSHATLLTGRRFILQAEDGRPTRSLTDARGALSLRLTPNTNYTLRSIADDSTGADNGDAFLKLKVDSDGRVNITESRRLFASDLKSESPVSSERDASSAKFQSARFGESVFAP